MAEELCDTLGCLRNQVHNVLCMHVRRTMCGCMKDADASRYGKEADGLYVIKTSLVFWFIPLVERSGMI